ncbi:4-amino-4-deoxy-L-arabinose-phosphoundecaprenol flippase subunit ArnE [Citrobacter freundii]|jgi:undecaprenyl phosphate-alpha-L-ara4N flippase subunit ArnE|uniref:4-amino-4-deoxy-L-arabinose-phosphoundecaprenol flippase subunit ArnE n=1 Tax=Citrobacter freundii TaxID=546 RepID=UPI0015EADD9B|nr:4-amino-4-deoxy-L-arabinose-phosphoundecaprenol flippase subunit ArnE [Citrobacter freundii]QMJ04298.1 4-amino-4-deoxy-L-arabinose-phosphoundecaprenol flippase subunit ArnE [Citrobacter freundii]QMJ13367.1 4-amino-4-deoxy-L-arabinose-phosphoundecaprenol flippase subunit ArnE [Citrobacter freundii]
MIWLALVLASLLSVGGQLCQKQATRARKRHIAWWISLALASLGLAMLLWLAVLQNIPVGIAYPMLSLNFVWVTLAAWKIWREPVTKRHWLGVGLIITGIFILGSAV